jgi:hypothetical protein
MRKARVMPAWERILGHEVGARIFSKLLKKKYLRFVFVENKTPRESISVSNAMIPDDGGLTLRFPT